MILDDPFDDPPDLPVPDRSPEPTREQLDVSVSAEPMISTGSYFIKIEPKKTDSVPLFGEKIPS